MAKKSTITKLSKLQKYPVRNHSYCKNCGRTYGYIRRFGLCRICFRNNALMGLIPGVKKISW